MAFSVNSLLYPCETLTATVNNVFFLGLGLEIKTFAEIVFAGFVNFCGDCQ